jgi:hypothetical protein
VQLLLRANKEGQKTQLEKVGEVAGFFLLGGIAIHGKLDVSYSYALACPFADELRAAT